MPRSMRSVAGLATLACLLMSGGCARPAANAALKGHPPAVARRVGGCSVREARPGGADTTFTFRAAPGRMLVVFFGFTHCPDVCPTTLSDLRRAARKLGRDGGRLEVAFVSVDLERDTPAVLEPYLHAYFADGHALAPRSQEELLAAQVAFGATSSVSRGADGDLNVAHTAASYVVDEQGHVLLEWDFGIGAKDMASDLHTLLSRRSAS
jgi:protein SCO1